MTADEIQEMLDGSAVSAALGIRVLSADAEEARATLRMPFQELVERARGTGQFHGGPIATLVDLAGDMAVAARVGGGVPTVDLRVDYLRPAQGAHLDARARARKVGRTLAVVDVDVTDEAGRLCATGRGTYATRIG